MKEAVLTLIRRRILQHLNRGCSAWNYIQKMYFRIRSTSCPEVCFSMASTHVPENFFLKGFISGFSWPASMHERASYPCKWWTFYQFSTIWNVSCGRQSFIHDPHGIALFTMAQMAHFSFPYYFTIPNSEFRNLHDEFRNSEFGIVKYI